MSKFLIILGIIFLIVIGVSSASWYLNKSENRDIKNIDNRVIKEDLTKEKVSSESSQKSNIPTASSDNLPDSPNQTNTPSPVSGIKIDESRGGAGSN